jgi:hypothetical protein
MRMHTPLQLTLHHRFFLDALQEAKQHIQQERQAADRKMQAEYNTKVINTSIIVELRTDLYFTDE